MTFHKEGIPSLILTIVFIAMINTITHLFLDVYIVTVLGYCISAFLFIVIVQFFRSPKRELTSDDDIVYSPADGKVVVIEEVQEDEYFKDKRLQVSIFMSPINVHVNWYPITGIIKYLKYHNGKYLVAFHPKSSTENERTTIVVEKNEKQNVLLRQIAGAMARRIVYYGKEKEDVNQGNQLGFIKFGSRVDMYLPLGTKINVKLGDKVTGCKTEIARFQ